MGTWRKIFIYLLILALPVSTMAGLDVNTDCPHSTQESNVLIKQSTDSHCETTTNSDFVADLSTAPTSDCQCHNNLDCTSAGINLAAIASSSKFAFTDSNDQVISYLVNHLLPVTLTPLFRPPISIS